MLANEINETSDLDKKKKCTFVTNGENLLYRPKKNKTTPLYQLFYLVVMTGFLTWRMLCALLLESEVNDKGNSHFQ